MKTSAKYFGLVVVL